MNFGPRRPRRRRRRQRYRRSEVCEPCTGGKHEPRDGFPSSRPKTAPTLVSDGDAQARPGVEDTWSWKPFVHWLGHPSPVQVAPLAAAGEHPPPAFSNLDRKTASERACSGQLRVRFLTRSTWRVTGGELTSQLFDIVQPDTLSHGGK